MKRRLYRKCSTFNLKKVVHLSCEQTTEKAPSAAFFIADAVPKLTHCLTNGFEFRTVIRDSLLTLVIFPELII